MSLAFQPRKPDIASVWRWFEFQRTLIAEELAKTIKALTSGSGDIANAVFPRLSRLAGRTRQEVEEFFGAQRAELEFLTMFELLASTEAVLRRDFWHRVRARKKDSLSRRYRAIHSERRNNGNKAPIRLREDILQALDEEGVRVSDFRGALKLRNWLAHGRYWNPKLGYSYTPDLIFDTSENLIDSVPR